MPAKSTLLWAGAGDGRGPDRELLQTTLREFGVAAHFCSLAELPDALGARRVEVVTVELGTNLDATCAVIRELQGRSPRLAVLAASTDASVGVIRAALEAGATDFLTLPLSAQELHKALIRATQANARPEAEAESRGEVLTVCGARGGLGATTVAVNLAFRLAKLTAESTALVDLDLQRGDVAAFLNLTPLNSLATVADARGEVDEIFLAGTLTRHPNGVFVLPAPPQMEEADAVGHDAVQAALGVLRRQFRWTVVDTARTVSGATVAAFEQSHRVLLLTDLSIPGVRAARRLVELLGRLGMPLAQVELLVADPIGGPVSLQDAAGAIGKAPLLQLPRDAAAAAQAMNAGVPLNGRPTGLALALSDLAAKVAGQASSTKPGAGERLRRLFGRNGRSVS